MLNNSPALQNLLKRHGISFDVGKRLSKKIVSKYTSIDDYGYIEVCYGGDCYETHLKVDEDFLRDELNYNWKRIILSGGDEKLYNHLIFLMGDDLDFSYDFSVFFIINFLCPEIYDVYYKPMESDNINESMGRNKKYEITKEDLKKLLYHYTVDMGYHKESAIEDLKDLIRWFNSLPNKIKLYRLLYLNDDSEINYDELGSHYSDNKRDLIDNHYNKGSIYGDIAPKNKIDFIETLTNNILFPNEQEITLEDKGRGVDFIKVEKL
jgi:hypothetical protein